MCVFNCSPIYGRELGAGDHEPCISAGDRAFEVFAEASAAVQLDACAFIDPSARQRFETLCDIGSLHDLQGAMSEAP